MPKTERPLTPDELTTLATVLTGRLAAAEILLGLLLARRPDRADLLARAEEALAILGRAPGPGDTRPFLQAARTGLARARAMA